MSSAWPWWGYYWKLRRGNRTTKFNFLGIITGGQTVTTTIEIAEPVSPEVSPIVSRLAVGVLTLATACWAVISLMLITAPQSPFLLRLFAVIMDAIIITFVVNCWDKLR